MGRCIGHPGGIPDGFGDRKPCAWTFRNGDLFRDRVRHLGSVQGCERGTYIGRHEVGDKVIASLADRVRSLIRETDIVCRFGAGIPDRAARTALSDTAFVAEKVRRGVADLRLDPTTS